VVKVELIILLLSRYPIGKGERKCPSKDEEM
jgi:hypothetical protein